MDAKQIKNRIIEEDKIKIILQELGCGNIKNSGKFYSCSNPDGDNPVAMLVYKNNLDIKNYTRNVKNKFNKTPDLFDYVNFIRKDKYFTENLKWICDICGYDYYENIKRIDSDTLNWLDNITKIKNMEEIEVAELIPIDEKILSYYKNIPNKMWYDEGISKKTQMLFGIGIDLDTHSITIPIRDELGTLIGVKARFLQPTEMKYIYIEPCAKSQILYGLDKTIKYIKEKSEIIIVESEKSVLKLYDMGIKNCVSIGCHTLSRHQVKKISMLGVNEIILAYDKDVGITDKGNFDKEYWKSEVSKFMFSENVSIIYDNFGILKDKESPADKRKDEFIELYNRRINAKDAQL